MNKLAAVTLLVAAVGTSACGKADQFKQALPTRATVQLNVPAHQGQALSTGDPSQFMIDSKNTADGINGGVLWVFDIIDHILATPPTTADDASAVWGPSEPKGLERNSFRFTVNKVADGDFTYQLEARAKGATEESDFVVLFDGEAFPGDDDKGTGTMNAYAGAARGLNSEDCNSGTIHVSYDASAEPRSLAVQFEDFLNVCETPDGQPANADYLYTESQDGAGTLDFALTANIHGSDEAKPLQETLSIKTRWLASGSGRADVVIQGGEVPGDLAAAGLADTQVVATECWDDLFGLTYADTTPIELRDSLHGNAGDEASCAFAEADLSSI